MTMPLSSSQPQLERLLDDILALSPTELRSLWHQLPMPTKQVLITTWSDTQPIEQEWSELVPIAPPDFLDQLDIPRGKVLTNVADFAFPEWAEEGDDEEDFMVFLARERALSKELTVKRFQKQFDEEW